MKRILCLLTISLLSILSAAAQSIDELNADIKRAEAAIAKNEKLLKEVSASKKSNQTEIRLLQQKIKDRQKIVGNYDKQIKLVNKDISAKKSNVNSMQREVRGLEGEVSTLNLELERLKDEYAKALRADYKNMLVSAPLHFLFSSEDINTATQRITMLERYREALSDKGDKIVVTTELINAKAQIISNKSLEVEGEIKTLSDKEKQLKTLKNQQQKELDKLNKPRETIFVFRERGTGRPTKKERREIDALMDSFYYEDDDE